MGRHLLSLELATLTSDSNGKVQDSKGFHCDFRLNNSDVARIRKYGMDLIPGSRSRILETTMFRRQFDNKMPEGTYLFQLVVTDKQNRSCIVAPALDFEIRNPE